jgi:hypothetical protein
LLQEIIDESSCFFSRKVESPFCPTRCPLSPLLYLYGTEACKIGFQTFNIKNIYNENEIKIFRKKLFKTSLGNFCQALSHLSAQNSLLKMK